MSLFNLSNVARAGASSLRNVSSRHGCCNVASKMSLSMASTQQKRHATQNTIISHWPQHPLGPSTLSNESPSELSSRSKGSPGKHTAYIALGSNLGDRIDMIERACNEMSTRGIKIKRTSCLWETEPMYVLGQGNFVNGACEVRMFVP
jgi:2-amino-4-hydroxy-6-hydroxymethyldihydropteridine diphosphokinase/dihydropteroate synthase